MKDSQFEEWIHYQHPRIPAIQDAYAAGRIAGINWAEIATANICLEIAQNVQGVGLDGSPAGVIAKQIKEKFGLGTTI
jgi:hypothetical protein